MTKRPSLRRAVFDLIPAYNESIYRICRRYVDRFNGDNDSDPSRNGERRFLSEELSKLEQPVIFDVGANVGEWSAFVIGVCSDASLHSFEPGSFAFTELGKKAWPPNVRINKLALGNAEGEGLLHIDVQRPGLSSLHSRALSAECDMVTESVRISTIDTYCTRFSIAHINLMKIDVEGHELSVLHGGRQMLSRGAIDTIQFEYGGCALDAGIRLRDIWMFLEGFGFRFYKIFPEGLRAVPAYDQRHETFQYSNWVASRIR